MIKVSLLGHIKSSVGRDELEFPEAELEAEALVEKIRSLSRERTPGFTKYNTLVMVEDGEAFVPAANARKVKSGQKVVLIPFSHGG